MKKTQTIGKIMEELELFVYEVEYTSSSYHNNFSDEIVAKDADEAWDIASGDYYFGTMVSCEELYEATEEQRKEYESEQ
jgi:hypothetical protein